MFIFGNFKKALIVVVICKDENYAFLNILYEAAVSRDSWVSHWIQMIHSKALIHSGMKQLSYSLYENKSYTDSTN